MTKNFSTFFFVFKKCIVISDFETYTNDCDEKDGSHSIFEKQKQSKNFQKGILKKGANREVICWSLSLQAKSYSKIQFLIFNLTFLPIF